jgi:hypothetical protein
VSDQNGRQRHTCGASGGINVVTGLPCGQATGAGRRCIWHPADLSPQEALEDRSRVAKTGAEEAAQRIARVLPLDTALPKLENPAQVRALVAETINLTRTGRMHPTVANSVYQGCHVVLKLAELELSAEVGELEARMRELQEGRPRLPVVSA